MSLLDTTKLFAAPMPSPVLLSGDTTCYFADSARTSFDADACVCAIGAFDGVHRGHRALIGATLKQAQELGCPCYAVTFDPDPARILAPEHAQDELLCINDRIRLLLSLGLDGVVVINFTEAFASHTYQEFLDQYVRDLLHCCSINVGTNFRMGKGGKGGPEALRSYAQQFGIAVHDHELEVVLDHPVSATRIRSLLRAGRTGAASSLLGRPHTIRGHVEHGRGQGASFGFPTANIHVDTHVCMPAEGVYAAWVGTGERMWPAAVNVGAPRTFGGKVGVPLVEATLIGFEGDLYDQELICCFYEWLRAPKHFSTLESLEKTVLENIDWVRINLGAGELGDN